MIHQVKSLVVVVDAVKVKAKYTQLQHQEVNFLYKYNVYLSTDLYYIQVNFTVCIKSCIPTQQSRSQQNVFDRLVEIEMVKRRKEAQQWGQLVQIFKGFYTIAVNTVGQMGNYKKMEDRRVLDGK